MSWFPIKGGPSWLQRACTGVVTSGPVPRHVAFIMDGNRRFATKNSMDRAEGHLKGFDKLAETLEWCRDLGIAEVTVYAFSIENFKRSKEEVECLMEIARQKFARLLEEREMLEKHAVRVRVIGNIDLLPADIQELVSEVMRLTRDNKQATLNVCFSYTSRHEVCEAMKLCARGVQQGIIRPSDVTEELLEQCLFTRSSHPDLVVRTSGEVRLSDFLLVQSRQSVLSFVKVLWPEFSIWHLYAAVLHYQANYDAIQKCKNDSSRKRQARVNESDAKCCELEGVSRSAYTEQRLVRLTRFLDYIQFGVNEAVETLGDTQTVVDVQS